MLYCYLQISLPISFSFRVFQTTSRQPFKWIFIPHAQHHPHCLHVRQTYFSTGDLPVHPGHLTNVCKWCNQTQITCSCTCISPQALFVRCTVLIGHLEYFLLLCAWVIFLQVTFKDIPLIEHWKAELLGRAVDDAGQGSLRYLRESQIVSGPGRWKLASVPRGASGSNMTHTIGRSHYSFLRQAVGAYGEYVWSVSRPTVTCMFSQSPSEWEEKPSVCTACFSMLLRADH